MAHAIAQEARLRLKTRSTSRAGSSLLFGLAPRGVFRASGVTTGAVGSYPTFSPLPNVACIFGVPQVSLRDCHRAALCRRSILCGTFRSAVVAPVFTPASSTLPPGVTRRVAHVLSSVDRSPFTTGGIPPDGFVVAPGFSPALLSPLCVCLLDMNAERPTCLTTVSGLSSRFGLVAAALRRHSSASASDHPAHPPTQLYAFPA